MATWSFEIQADPELPVTATAPDGVSFTLPVDEDAVEAGVVQGEVTFDCGTRPTTTDLGNTQEVNLCFCELSSIYPTALQVETPVNTEIYDLMQFVRNYLGQVPLPDGGTLPDELPVPEVRKKPAVRIAPDVDFVAFGRCCNVFIVTELEFTPGEVVIPAIDAGPVSLGPWPFKIGAPFTSTMRSTYRLCCCTWTDTLDDLDDHDPGQEWEAAPPSTEMYDEECDCRDHAIHHLKTIADDTTTVAWTITAEEKDCDRQRGYNRDPERGAPGGGRPVKRTNAGNATERTHSPA